MTPVWTLQQAQELCAQLEPELRQAGFGIALGGSVLHKGQSFHDLDLILFPMQKLTLELFPNEKAKARDVLLRLGAMLQVHTDTVHEHWRKKGSNDIKQVEIWRYQNKRIDIFFLS